ncbi:MAG TPA: protein kinase [Thermoanaerobaculia bacterium]|nr:protein kinase [Thermoanaerobaculia bacterium]
MSTEILQHFCRRCSTLLDGDAVACPSCGASPPSQGWTRDSLLGTTVVGGQYRVLRRLGEGGFGVVYEVETVVGRLRRALKVSGTQWAANPAVQERFVNEALVLEEINHPNVARCYAVGLLEAEGAPYLLLELVDGIDLEQLLWGEGEEPRLVDPLRALRLAKQLASGLAAAHQRGILHRDLKPANVMLVRAGRPGEQVKVLDFGIAKLIPDGKASTANIVGTPQYMAPEQFLPGTPLDARLDIWQLGALLYFMLTGSPPYPVAEGDRVLGMISRHEAHRESGPHPVARRGELTAFAPLDEYVSRLLASDPDRRPASAAEVCEDLARLDHLLSPGSSSSTSLALLAVICAEPSEGGWWALCRYLETQGDGDEQGTLLRASEPLLAGWPDTLRRARCGWWERVRRGEPHPLWGLARTLDLAGRGLTDADALRLAESPALARITRLDLTGNTIGNDGLAALAASAHLAGLRSLRLGGNPATAAGIEALAAGGLRELRSLDLGGLRVGPRGAQAIAASGWALEELWLTGGEVGTAGIKALAQSQLARTLIHLELGGNRIGSDGAAALAASPHLAQLQHLELANEGIGPGGAAALAVSNQLGALRYLGVARNGLGREGLELLVASRRFENLEGLDLAGNGIGAGGAMVLASAPLARRLRRLDISDDLLGDPGLAALLGAPQLAGLAALRVAHNGITAGGAALLAGALPQLAALDLSGNQLGQDGAEALSTALERMRAQQLQARGCGLTGTGAAALLRGARGSLQELDLAGNPLGGEGVAQLTSAAELAAVRLLDLSDTGCGPAGTRALAACGSLGAMRELRLDSDELEDAGVASLARGGASLPLLESLSLADDRLGWESAMVLAASPLAPHLVRLDLSHNPIGDEGVEALSRGPAWSSLRELRLENTGAGMAGATALLAAPGTAQLHHLDLSHNPLGNLVDVHSLGREVVAQLESSFALISARGDELTDRFYAELFARYPSIKPLFAHVEMKRQKRHLLTALVFFIDNLRRPDLVEGALLEMGRRHVGYGVFPSHYYALTDTLVDALGELLGDAWSDDLRRAWLDAIEAVSAVMMRAHQEGQGAAPPPPTDAPPPRPAY